MKLLDQGSNHNNLTGDKLWQTMFKWLDQGKCFVKIEMMKTHIFFLLVPEKYKDEKIQATFTSYFDMKHIREEV